MQLAMELERWGSCIVIDAEHAAGRSSGWFAEREAQARFVIYLDATGDSVLAPALPAPGRRAVTARAGLTTGTTLARSGTHASVARGPSSTPLDPAACRTPTQPRLRPALACALQWSLQHHHVGGRADIGRLARLISGHARGLVLAGGGARGLAHLGALRALREAGHVFDAVGGTSIGAIIGAGVASGWELDAMVGPSAAASSRDARCRTGPCRSSR